MSLPRWSVLGLVATLASACATPACLRGAESPDDAALGADALVFDTRVVDRSMPDVDAIGYDVALRVSGDAGAESCAGDARGTVVGARGLDARTHDLDGNVVDDVKVGGAAARYRRDGASLVVTLPARAAAGSTITTRIRLHGLVRQADGTNPNDFTAYGGLMVRERNAEGRRLWDTLDWPGKARRWLPLRDHPRDGAMFAVSATFPRAYTVVANGKRVAQADNADGTRTWRYEALTPMPTYDFHVAAYDAWTASEARAASGVPVASYLYARDAAKQAAVFGDLTKAMDAYEASYGPYRWGTASFLEEPIFGGGMEHASVVSLDETLFANPASARKTAFHELAHHWSGNLVRIRTWNDFWLSEGFTEYLTAKAIGKVDGAAAEQATWKEYRARALAADLSARHALRPADPEGDVLAIFDGISYQKGACTLHMLEHMLGEGAMTAFLRGWFDRHAFSAVTTADLEKELGAAAGKDLSGFFREMVYTAGHPELAVSTEASGGSTELRVEQTQAGGPPDGYHVPLEVDLFDAQGATKRVVVDLTARTTTLSVPGFAAARVVADPDEVLVGSVALR